MDTSPSLPEALGQLVRQALAEAGISQRDASERTGIPMTTLQRRLNGLSAFPMDELVRLALLTNVTASHLLAQAEALTEAGAA